MTTSRRIALIAGALFLISYAGVFAGSAMYSPLVDAPDYLTLIYPNRSQLVLGILIGLINDAAVIGIAIVLYPLLKKIDETLAMGYVAFRVVEAVTLIVGKLNLLSLIPLSQAYGAAGAAEQATYQAAGALALGASHWADQVTLVFFSLGGLILYTLLYRSRLVPRFIPIWGVLAVVGVVVANVMGPVDISEGFSPVVLLVFPIMLNELFLAVWLIVKGFRPQAVPGEPARREAVAV